MGILKGPQTGYKPHLMPYLIILKDVGVKITLFFC